MDISLILMNSSWTALFAGGMGTILARSTRYVLPAVACGFTGRCVRDVSMALGGTQSWATVLGAAMVVLVAAACVRRSAASPIVLISGVLPLAAAMPMFHAVIGLMRLPTLKGDALNQATIAVATNTAKVFTITLAIAMGLAAGLAIARLIGASDLE